MTSAGGLSIHDRRTSPELSPADRAADLAGPAIRENDADRRRSTVTPGWMRLELVAAYAGDRTMTAAERAFVTTQKDARGSVFYSDLLYTISHHYFAPELAAGIWEDTLDHKRVMSERLGRQVGIVVAALDYLTNVVDKLASTTLISEPSVATITNLSMRDGMTGLFNHSSFLELLQLEFRRERPLAVGVSLILLDVDDFKAINDRCGHQERDRVLIELARVMEQQVRDSDICCRIGGEEFAVILPFTSEPDVAFKIANCIRPAATEISVGRRRLSVSVGVAASETARGSRRSLFQRADQAMYQAKVDGKNRVVLAAAADKESSKSIPSHQRRMVLNIADRSRNQPTTPVDGGRNPPGVDGVGAMFDPAEADHDNPSADLSAHVDSQQIVDHGNDALLDENAQLRTIIRRKDEFLAVIAHDLRAPLATAIGMTRLMASPGRRLSDRQSRGSHVRLATALTGASVLLDSLLGWSVSGLSSKAHDVACDLHELVDREILLQLPMAEQKGTRLTNAITDTLSLHTDRDVLSFVVRNLLANAVKYSDQKGRITVSVRDCGESFEFAVADTGVGMSIEARQGLFRHKKLDSAPGTAGETGTGIGLFLVEDFVQRLGGSIRVDSEVGVGTTVRFTVPRTKGSAAHGGGRT